MFDSTKKWNWEENWPSLQEFMDMDYKPTIEQKRMASALGTPEPTESAQFAEVSGAEKIKETVKVNGNNQIELF